MRLLREEALERPDRRLQHAREAGRERVGAASPDVRDHAAADHRCCKLKCSNDEPIEPTV